MVQGLANDFQNDFLLLTYCYSYYYSKQARGVMLYTLTHTQPMINYSSVLWCGGI